MVWSPTHGLDVSVDGVPIFGDLATPGFAPTSRDMLAFSAITGGLSQQVLIDDVVMAPEPGTLPGLLAGIGFLCAAQRRRGANGRAGSRS